MFHMVKKMGGAHIDIKSYKPRTPTYYQEHIEFDKFQETLLYII